MTHLASITIDGGFSMHASHTQTFSQIFNVIQSNIIGTLNNLPKPRGDSDLLLSIQSAATARGADGCIFIGEFADGSTVWGQSDLTFKSLFSSNIHHSYFIAPSILSLPVSLLKNLNSSPSKITLFFTNNSKSLVKLLSSIPQHPALQDLYARYFNSPHFQKFSLPTQTNFNLFFKKFILSPTNTKLLPSDFLNPKAFSNLNIVNQLAAIEAVCSIQQISIKKALPANKKSSPAWRPESFTKPIVTPDISWTSSIDSTQAA